ncbi:hypothetical protein Tco_0089378 [Tanacetum coccineum]
MLDPSQGFIDPWGKFGDSGTFTKCVVDVLSLDGCTSLVLDKLWAFYLDVGRKKPEVKDTFCCEVAHVSPVGPLLASFETVEKLSLPLHTIALSLDRTYFEYRRGRPEGFPIGNDDRLRGSQAPFCINNLESNLLEEENHRRSSLASFFAKEILKGGMVRCTMSLFRCWRNVSHDVAPKTAPMAKSLASHIVQMKVQFGASRWSSNLMGRTMPFDLKMASLRLLKAIVGIAGALISERMRRGNVAYGQKGTIRLLREAGTIHYPQRELEVGEDVSTIGHMRSGFHCDYISKTRIHENIPTSHVNDVNLVCRHVMTALNIVLFIDCRARQVHVEVRATSVNNTVGLVFGMGATTGATMGQMDYETDFETTRRLDVFGASLLAGGIVSFCHLGVMIGLFSVLDGNTIRVVIPFKSSFGVGNSVYQEVLRNGSRSCFRHAKELVLVSMKHGSSGLRAHARNNILLFSKSDEIQLGWEEFPGSSEHIVRRVALAYGLGFPEMGIIYEEVSINNGGPSLVEEIAAHEDFRSECACNKMDNK